jgi:hypothetical protein
MPLVQISGTAAWEQLQRSQSEYGDGWWNREGVGRGDVDNAMTRRFAGDTVLPEPYGRDALRCGGNVFAIGSCFARRIEDALMRAGAPCLSQSDALKVEGARLFGTGWEFWNKYNTYSILSELRWALESPGFEESALVEVEPNRYWDYHLHLGRYRDLGAESSAGSRHVLVTFHRAVSALFGAVRAAQIVIVTLGLNEVWLDSQTGLRLTDPPSRRIVDKLPGRFVFEVPTVEENLHNLEQVYTLLRSHCPHLAQIIVTVSPVPLGATFSGQDVLVANTLSKSALRYVASAWATQHSDVVYAPVFEMAINSRRDIVWEEDQLHVSTTFADRIVGHFVGNVSDRHGCGPRFIEHPPEVVESNFNGFTLVKYEGQFVALASTVSSSDVSAFSRQTINEYRLQGLWLEDATVGALKERLVILGSYRMPAELVETGYRGFNLLTHGGRYVAVSQALGAMDLCRVSSASIEEFRTQWQWFEAPTLADLKRELDACGIDWSRPELVETNYRGFNIVRYGRQYYAIAGSIGAINVSQEQARVSELMSRKQCCVAATLDGVRSAVDNLQYWHVPELLEQGYEGFNLVGYEEHIHAIAQALGPIDVTSTGNDERSQYIGRGFWLVADTLTSAKVAVDELRRSRASSPHAAA